MVRKSNLKVKSHTQNCLLINKMKIFELPHTGTDMVIAVYPPKKVPQYFVARDWPNAVQRLVEPTHFLLNM